MLRRRRETASMQPLVFLGFATACLKTYLYTESVNSRLWIVDIASCIPVSMGTHIYAYYIYKKYVSLFHTSTSKSPKGCPIAVWVTARMEDEIRKTRSTQKCLYTRCSGCAGTPGEVPIHLKLEEKVYSSWLPQSAESPKLPAHDSLDMRLK